MAASDEMRIGNALTILGGLLVATGVFGGEGLPWLELHYSEMPVSGLEFNLSVALLALTVVSTGFAVTSLLTRDRIYAMGSTAASLLIAVATGAYAFGAAEILALPDTELVRAGAGLRCVLAGASVMLFGTIWVYASEVKWDLHEPLLRVVTLLRGTVMDERYLMESKHLKVGGDPKQGFLETTTFLVLFAAVSGVLPALVFGPMIGEYAAHRRRQRTLQVPTGDYPDGQRIFQVGAAGTASVGLTADTRGRLHFDQTDHQPGAYAMSHGVPTASGLRYVEAQDGDWGVISLIDGIRVFFQLSPLDVRVKRKSWLSVDYRIAGSLALSGLLQVSLILLTLFLWEEHAVKTERPDNRKLMRVDIQTSTLREPAPLEDLGQEEQEEGQSAGGQEGKFGDPDIHPDVVSRVPKREGKLVEKVDPRDIGLNSILSDARDNPLSSLLSDDVGEFANEIAVAMNGTGSEFILGAGTEGLGFRDTGTGGGGTGTFGTIQSLGNAGDGGAAVSTSLRPKKKKRVSTLRIGSGSSQGFCKKSDISKNVRRRGGAIRACYERELQYKPNLRGKLTARWTVNPQGRVSNASVVKSSLKNQAVEACVLRTVRRMRFAKPEGGVCVIQWPFVFNSSK